MTESFLGTSARAPRDPATEEGKANMPHVDQSKEVAQLQKDVAELKRRVDELEKKAKK